MTEPEELLHVSASSMDTWKTCPRKWYFNYIQKERGETTVSMMMGTFAHHILEEFYQWPAEEHTVELAKEIARYEWDKMVAISDEFHSLKLTAADEKKFRILAWGFTKGIWDLEDPTRIDVVDTERAFEIEYNGALVRGYIDRVSRVDGGLAIDDYKSGKPPGARYKAAKLFQVHLYALMAATLYDEPVVSAGLLYLGAEIIREDITPRIVKKTFKRVDETIVAIKNSKETGEFEATSNMLCGWCDFVTVCPEGEAFVRKGWSQGWLKPHATAIDALGIR